MSSLRGLRLHWQSAMTEERGRELDAGVNMVNKRAQRPCSSERVVITGTWFSVNIDHKILFLSLPCARSPTREGDRGDELDLVARGHIRTDLVHTCCRAPNRS